MSTWLISVKEQTERAKLVHEKKMTQKGKRN